jgi:DNA-binding LacI/PurR family transcriptional regulator
VTARKHEVTIREIAENAGLEVSLVLSVLKETAGSAVSKAMQDRIFQTARRLGYDLRKLKIGKRMQYRKETLEEVLEKIRDNPGMGRPEIVKYLKESLTLVERVHKRVFPEEYGG